MTSTDPADPNQGDPDLGEAGKRAIAAERDRANAAERQLRALQTQLDTAAARVTELEQTTQTMTGDLASRDLAISRLNIGIDKGLPRPLIERLQGADEAALAEDADALLALLPPATPVPGTPRPDPSQGGRSPGTSTPEQAFAAAMGPLLN